MASTAWGGGEAWRMVAAEALGIAIQAPTGLMVQVSDRQMLALVRPAGADDFETVQLYRVTRQSGDPVEDWNHELGRLSTSGGWQDIRRAPLQWHLVADYTGVLGVLRFMDRTGVLTDAALWYGQGGEGALIFLYRCGLARERFLYSTVNTVLNSLSFLPRPPVERPTGRARRAASPVVVFGINLLLALALIAIGILLQRR